MTTRLERLDSSGWSTGMMIVPLGEASDGVLVYSPTWLGRDTFERVEQVGTPTILVAPNHFHHLALPRFRERYPDVQVVASDVAQRRLNKKGHRDLVAPSAVDLPKHMHLIACDHTKTGELWLSLDSDDGRHWMIGDAFFNESRPVTGLLGAVLRWTKTTPDLCLGQTYRWLGIRDEQAYRRWLLATLDNERPEHAWFCHGTRLDDAADKLREVATRRLAGS